MNESCSTDTCEIVVKPSDELRHLLVEAFKKFEPQIQAYSEYAGRVAALGLEYKIAKLKEEYPACPIEELTKVLELELHSTPTTLDNRIQDMKAAGAVPKKVVIDRANQKISIYV